MQPIVDLRTCRLIGLESLARSDVKGLETPAKMFNAAEQLDQAAILSDICREKAIDSARGALKGQRLFFEYSPAREPRPRCLAFDRRNPPEAPVDTPGD